jgi:hypothetical protein
MSSEINLRTSALEKGELHPHRGDDRESGEALVAGLGVGDGLESSTSLWRRTTAVSGSGAAAGRRRAIRLSTMRFQHPRRGAETGSAAGPAASATSAIPGAWRRAFPDLMQRRSATTASTSS